MPGPLPGVWVRVPRAYRVTHIVADRAALCAYFGARNLVALERQFNNDGRLLPILIDAAANELLVATGPHDSFEVTSTFRFPVHVSDLLGQIEIDRRAAELKALQ